MARRTEDPMTERGASGGAPVADEAADLLTTIEAAQALGISQRTLQRLLEQGALKGSRVGRQWRFRREDLEAYLRRAPAPAAEPPEHDLAAALQAVGDDPDAPPVRVTTF